MQMVYDIVRIALVCGTHHTDRFVEGNVHRPGFDAERLSVQKNLVAPCLLCCLFLAMTPLIITLPASMSLSASRREQNPVSLMNLLRLMCSCSIIVIRQNQ
jgi:hypothetical protein